MTGPAIAIMALAGPAGLNSEQKSWKPAGNQGRFRSRTFQPAGMPPKQSVFQAFS